MPVTLVTTATSEPFELSEVKNNLRVTINDDDALIKSLIIVSREWAESYMRRALITQTWDYFTDRFFRTIKLPLSPVVSVTSIKYVDTDGVTQTLATTEYTVDSVSEPTRIVEAWGKTWPSIRFVPNAVTVRFVAGYGNASDIPEQIKRWMLMLMGHLYENRELTSQNVNIVEIPISTELLFPYRVIQF